MNVFLNKDECNHIIEDVQTQQWYKKDNGYRYHQTGLYTDGIYDKIISKFESIKNVNVVKDKAYMRILKLQKNDKIPTYVFDYSTYNYPSGETNFGVVIFLNDEYTGGEFYINSKKINIKIGEGIIHTRTTKGKISKIINGECYILIAHIYHLTKEKLI